MVSRGIDTPLGTLTPTELHAIGLGAVSGVLTGMTRAWSQLRAKPWYAAVAFMVGLLAGQRYRESRT